eukprot:TRINITY_DN26368_c0_g1_i1.p1 TRINITY_DN26368_c0_g1~~TRINITY_DN26368_c0_g1_i1.p1  ORF type:complete len:327 (+),score=33.31 TRINITY_DN26368_c0_g1_i1:3-983(+)
MNLEEEDIYDRTLVYLSTIVPMGTIADELSPAKWLKSIGYTQPPSLTAKEEKTHQQFKLQLTETHFGDINCGYGSTPTAVGHLTSEYESLHHSAPDIPFNFTVSGALQDLTVSSDIIEETTGPDHTTRFNAKFVEGTRLLMTYMSPTSSTPVVKGVLKAYLPKDGASGTLDLRFQLTLGMTPLDSCKKVAWCEVEVTFELGNRSVTSQSLIPSGGMLKVVTDADGTKKLVWRLPKAKKQPEVSSLSGRCALVASPNPDASSFLADNNCYANVSFTAYGYTPSSNISITHAATHDGAPVAIQPPILKGSGLRVWNSKATEPAAARVL